MNQPVNSLSAEEANKRIYDNILRTSEPSHVENAGPIESTVEPNFSENNFDAPCQLINVPVSSELSNNSGTTESPMKPNFSENNFRLSGFDGFGMDQSVNLYENERKLSSVSLTSEPSHVEVTSVPAKSPMELNFSENYFRLSEFDGFGMDQSVNSYENERRLTSEPSHVEVTSVPAESPMEPNFSENNFRLSGFDGFEMDQSDNSYENERRLSSVPFTSEPSHVEQGRIGEIDQHWNKNGENTSTLSLPSMAGFHPSAPNGFEVFGSSLDESAIPYNGFQANVNRPTFPSQQSENYTMRAPRPSGRIGARFHHEDSEHNNVPSITKDSTFSLSEHIKNFSNPIHFKPVELKPNIPDEMRHNFGSTDNSDDSPSSSSPKGIKRKPVVSNDNNGCRRCTCTKTKCLKLYCVCFAFKVLCSDSCTCQNCSNRLQYNDIVLQRVQMVESRNPAAFDPKISEPSSNNSVNGGVHHTVASARHRKGCNCKKSKCSKNYCECFQFGVGCSDRCRCEGCENVHGRKGDYSMNKNRVSNHDNNNNNKILSGSYNEIKNDNLLNEFGNPYDNHQMSVTTPSIPLSNHGETTQNSCVPQMPFQPSYSSSSYANIIQVPNHQSSPEMVMNQENNIDHGIRPQVPFDGQLQYCGIQNTTMSSFWPQAGVLASNSPNNYGLGVPALNSPNNFGFGVPALNSPNNFGFGVPALNSPNNSVVNSSIQSGGNSCVRIFSSTFKDGIPKEESPLIPVVTPPPNKIQVSPPFGVHSSIGLKLNLSRFHPCNNFQNQENKNPNDQQNCSRQGR